MVKYTRKNIFFRGEIYIMQGYLYVAIGEKFLKEAIISANSLRKIDNNAHITLVTDNKIDATVFNNIIVKPTTINNFREGLLYKVEHIYNSSPYDKTLFLDTDTYICESCLDLFKLLDFFDLAIAQDPTDVNRAKIPESLEQLKASDLYNTGVILFIKNQRNEALFTNWLNIYKSKINQKTVNKENDQTSFIESWLQSESKIYVLSHAWNARTPFFFTLNQSVKIIHGRHKNYQKIQKKLNQPNYSRHRCWLPIQEKCVIKKSGFLYHYKVFGKTQKDRIYKIANKIQKFLTSLNLNLKN